MNDTEMVRSYAAANGIIRRKDIKKALGLKENRLIYAVDTLKKQGFLKSISHGVYQFCSDVEKQTGPQIIDRIWKAMKIKKIFTAAEIAQLSGSTINYIYKCFRFFRADKFIVQHGLVKGTSEKAWRLTQSGKEKALKPKFTTYKPDPLVLAVVELNRLICSGFAIRDEKAAKEAILICQKISKALQEDMKL